MLTQDQEKYLLTIPGDKKVTIKPFSHEQTKIAEEVITRIQNSSPDLKVVHMGASGLGISGQGDIDPEISVTE